MSAEAAGPTPARVDPAGSPAAKLVTHREVTATPSAARETTAERSGRRAAAERNLARLVGELEAAVAAGVTVLHVGGGAGVASEVVRDLNFLADVRDKLHDAVDLLIDHWQAQVRYGASQ